GVAAGLGVLHHVTGCHERHLFFLFSKSESFRFLDHYKVCFSPCQGVSGMFLAYLPLFVIEPCHLYRTVVRLMNRNVT
ncbi:MAG: hypothetical protein ABS897_07675, partial [Eubacteriales bacterium]